MTGLKKKATISGGLFASVKNLILRDSN